MIGPEKQKIEIQIRTHEMNEVNELGVAAHWAYKQNMKFPVDGRQYRWIRELLSIIDNSSTEEFLEHTKLEIYEDQVFCFTPAGFIVALPKGATALDFAYAMHSDIGNFCMGAKINGKIAQIRTKLENGDQVEILKSEVPLVSPAWDKFAVTGKAKAAIKKFIRQKEKYEYLSLGKSMMTKYIQDINPNHDESKMIPLLEAHLKEFNKKSVDEVFLAAAYGTLQKEEVSKILESSFEKPKLDFRSGFGLLNFNKKPKTLLNPVSIKGLIPGMAVNYAACCHPLPGDDIVGIQHVGKGITIHTADCEILENFISSPERWMQVVWDAEDEKEAYVSRIKAILLHEPGSLATVTQVIANNNANINNLKVLSRANNFFELIIDLEVSNVDQLNNIIASLRSKSCVDIVDRFKE